MPKQVKKNIGNVLLSPVRANKRHPKVVQQADYLSLLHRTKNKAKRSKLLELADKDQIDAISEVIENVLRGTIVLSQAQKQKLRRYKTCMRLLTEPRASLAKKKKQLKTY